MQERANSVKAMEFVFTASPEFLSMQPLSNLKRGSVPRLLCQA